MVVQRGQTANELDTARKGKKIQLGGVRVHLMMAEGLRSPPLQSSHTSCLHSVKNAAGSNAYVGIERNFGPAQGSGKLARRISAT